MRLGPVRASSRLRKGGHIVSHSSYLPGPILPPHIHASEKSSSKFPTSLVHSVPRIRPKPGRSGSPGPQITGKRVNRWLQVSEEGSRGESPGTTRRVKRSYVPSCELKRNQSYAEDGERAERGKRRSVSRAMASSPFRPQRPSPSPHPIRPMFYQSPPGRNSIYYQGSTRTPSSLPALDVIVVSKKLL